MDNKRTVKDHITDNQLEPKAKEPSHTTKENPSGCQFYVGYLSEREQKQQIPEGCIVCKDIVDCMLKRMRN